MNHTLRRAGELYSYANGRTIPVYTYDGWYKYDVHDGDTVVINDGTTSSMYILRGDKKCDECPISIDDSPICSACVKCKVTGVCRAVCRTELGVCSIDELLEDL